MWNWVHNNNNFASAFKILIIMRPVIKALVIWYKSWSDNLEQSLLQHIKLFFLRLCLSTKIATMSMFNVELKSSSPVYSMLFYATRRFWVSFHRERRRVSWPRTDYIFVVVDIESRMNCQSKSEYAVTRQKIQKRKEFFKTSKRDVLET